MHIRKRLVSAAPHISTAKMRIESTGPGINSRQKPRTYSVLEYQKQIRAFWL